MRSCPYCRSLQVHAEFVDVGPGGGEYWPCQVTGYLCEVCGAQEQRGGGWEPGPDMTRAERLRAASEADVLSGWVKVSRDGMVSWRSPEISDADPDGVIRSLFHVGRILKWNYLCKGIGLSGPLPTRDAAVRAGLSAMADKLEAENV
jgi:hypothetical protein